MYSRCHDVTVLLTNVVSGALDVSDFMHNKPGNIFFNRSGIIFHSYFSMEFLIVMVKHYLTFILS